MHQTTTISIEALDTLFFRDGKPFSMGTDSWANSNFPPYPSVFYGAIRSLYFSDHPAELVKASSQNDPTSSLKIKGLYLQHSESRKIDSRFKYFPLPLDCIIYKDASPDEKGKVFPLSPQKQITCSSCLTNYLLTLDGYREAENTPSGLIDEFTFRDYLEGKSGFYYNKLSDFVLDEPKIGIARDKQTLIAEEGKLYHVVMKRLKKLSFIVEFEGLEIKENGLMKLGGEQKAARYEKIDKLNVSGEKFELEKKRFKLYLATPAIFKQGWLPDWLDPKSLEGKYGSLKIKLICAAAGKPLHIGGFDMKKKKPKPMYRAVPAGSVYYFEIMEGDENSVWNLFNRQNISDFKAEEGFGLSFVGGYFDA
jgi:CRISPR-associated protein Cmr3